MKIEMAGRSTAKAIRILALAAAAGCSPGVGGAVGRAGPPVRSSSGPKTGSPTGTAGLRQSAGANADSRSEGPAEDISVSDPAVQALVVRAWALERSRRFRQAARAYEQAASSLKGDDSGSVRLLVRAFRLYQKARRSIKAYLVLEKARSKARRGFERLFVLRRMAELAGRMGPTRAVVGLYGRLRRSLAAGLLAPLAAAYWLEHGRPDKATEVFKESEPLRLRIEGTLTADQSIVPGRVGLLVSLRGPYRRAGISLVRGAMLAVMGGRPAAAARMPGFGLSRPQVWIEPVDDDAGVAVRRLAMLAKVGVAVGPVRPDRARQAALAAQQMNLALITVSPDPSVAGLGTQVFDDMPDTKRRLAQVFDAVFSELRCRRARARARSRKGRSSRRCPVTRRRRRSRKRRRGCVRDWSGPVAVIFPESPYGRALAQFLGALHPGGFESFFYKRGQTTFSDVVAGIKRRHVDAVVAVMPWRTLELFAPQMAAAGLWPGRGPKGLRRVLFGALGDGVVPSRLAMAQRYLEGTFLVPGFYPDEQDARWGGFVADYRRAYGSVPDMVAAYAYEAASIAARSVRGLQAGSAAAKIAALTIRGRRVFDDKGVLVRPSSLYVVTTGKLMPWKRKACRWDRGSRGGRWRRKR